MFIAQFKLRLIDCCFQKWHSGITDSTRCDTYKEFKSLLNVEKYLQKLRVRLWPCKTSLSPPVTLCYLSFQCDTSVVVRLFYVLVFKIFVLLARYVCFHIFS